MGDSDWVILGKIAGVYGVKGWVKVFSETAPITGILDYPVWNLSSRGGDWERFEVADGRPQGKGLIARLKGCEDRDQAAELVGREIAVTRDQLPAAEEGEFYWTDLEGMRVVTLEGMELGTVDHLFETGANDVMAVKGERERLLPFIASVVRRVDAENRLIEVDWDPEF